MCSRSRLLLAGLLALCACGPEESYPGAEGVTNDRYVLLLRSVDSAAASAAGIAGVPMASSKAVVSALEGVEVVYELDQLPMMVISTRDAELLARLRSSPEVAELWPDSANAAFDTASFAYIGQPAAADAGAIGTGATVAVLDTGLDYRNAAFGTCTTPGAAGCRVAFAQDFAPQDNQLDDNGHGTNVAGIIVGEAPGARVIGLDVFNGASAWSSDIINAINWVIANKATYNIVAMNLSLGGGSSTTTCASDVFAMPIAQARNAGVLAAIAAGNDGKSTVLASPACVPEALSVGAVYDANLGGLGYGVCTDTTTAAGKVACFSNSTSFLSLWAPGTMVTAAGSTMTGTSQATPHVAGALAVLAARFPADTVDQRASRLLTGAPQVKDARNSVTRPVLSLTTALAGCNVTLSSTAPAFTAAGGTIALTVTTGAGCTWSLTGLPTWVTAAPLSGTGPGTVRLTTAANPGSARSDRFQLSGVMVRPTQAEDTTAPTGTLTAPKLTRVATVTVSVTATDPSGVAFVCVTTDATCPATSTRWQAAAASVSVTLPSPDGARTVNAFFADKRGNRNATPAATATVVLDTTAPTQGTLALSVATASSAKLSWAGFSDAGSAVVKYLVTQSTTTADPPAGCTGTAVYSGTALTTTVAVPAKTARRFRLCAVDGAGNVSAGVVGAITMP
jgi:subtilisin family serine protease